MNGLLIINPRSGRGGPAPEEIAAVDVPSLGARERLDEGKLHLHVGTDERVGDGFVVAARTPRLEAAVDGEADVLATPIEFRIEPRALRLLVPDRSG